MYQKQELDYLSRYIFQKVEYFDIHNNRSQYMINELITILQNHFKGDKKSLKLNKQLTKLKKYMKNLSVSEENILNSQFMTETEQMEAIEQIMHNQRKDVNQYVTFMSRLRKKIQVYETQGKRGLQYRKQQEIEEMNILLPDIQTRLKDIKDPLVRKIIKDNIDSADCSDQGKQEKRANMQIDLQIINEQINSSVKININELRINLDKALYKMENIKEYLLLTTNQKMLNPEFGQSFLLIGPPGIGKTALLQKYAEYIGLEFIFISLAGQKESSVLKGHSFTYIGSQSGLIANEVIRKKSNQCLFLFDEVDKCHQQIQDILIQITDNQQNKLYADDYLEIPLDLSKCIFMFTANSEDDISSILRNRLKKIYMGDYTETDKIQIIKDYSISRISGNIRGSEGIQIPLEVIKFIVQNTYEKGLRQAEKQIEQLCLNYSMEKKQITLEYARNKLKGFSCKREIPFGMYI